MMRDWIILYDGKCGFCTYWIKYIEKKDKRQKFKIISLFSDSARTYLEHFNLPKENFKTLYVIHNDKCYKKSGASLEIFKNLGGFWKLLYGFIIIPEPLRDIFYDLIAEYRGRLYFPGKKNKSNF